MDLSHPHLVTHLGGWAIENELFLIFPTPVLTLKDLVLCRRSIYSTMKGIGNVVRQLAGIACAIDYLSQLQDGRNNFHHGIRLDNIYLFPIEHEKDLYTWKLGSFGTETEMFNFSEQTKTNTEAGWSENYAAPESHYDSDQTSKDLDVWSLGCVSIVVLYWLSNLVDAKMRMHPDENMWKPGKPIWQKNPHGNKVLRPSVTQFLEAIRASKPLPTEMRRLARWASACLVVDQKERGLLDLAKLIHPNTKRSLVGWAAGSETESETDEEGLYVRL